MARTLAAIEKRIAEISAQIEELSEITYWHAREWDDGISALVAESVALEAEASRIRERKQ